MTMMMMMIQYVKQKNLGRGIYWNKNNLGVDAYLLTQTREQTWKSRNKDLVLCLAVTVT